MANIFRGPLYVNRREVAPALGLSQHPSARLLALLATVVIAIPPGAQSFPLQSISKPLTFNADTSHGTPKTLFADKQLPFFVAPHFAPAPHRPGEWLNPDESAGTPKPLTADKQLPFFVAPHLAQLQHGRLEWLNSDTTQDMPPAFRVVPPAPFIPAPHLPPQRLWPLADTLQSTPAEAPPALPVGQTFQLAPVKFWWQPSDTTQDTPKTLTADAQLPFRILQQPLVKSWWQPADSTQSAYGPTHAIPILSPPPGAANWLGVPQYTWQFGDTTLESPPVAIQGVAPAPPVVVTTPLQGGARPPWGGTKKRRYVRIGNKEYIVSNERDVEYLINRELSKPIAPGKPKGKPTKVVAPETFEQKALNPVSVEIALRSQDEALIAIIKRLIAEHDETDIEIILLTL